MLSKKHKKLATIVIVIATIALMLTSFLPLLYAI
jgi:hypothetical protein